MKGAPLCSLMFHRLGDSEALAGTGIAANVCVAVQCAADLEDWMGIADSR